MMTFFAPAPKWAEAAAFPVKKPVDSMTTSTPSSSHGRSAGLRSDSTERRWPSTVIDDFVALTVPGKGPATLSCMSKCAMVSMEPRSLTATMSMSAPCSLTARKKFRPIRPKPLMATRTVTRTPLWIANEVSSDDVGERRGVTRRGRRAPPRAERDRERIGALQQARRYGFYPDDGRECMRLCPQQPHPD